MHWRRKWQPTPVFLPGESRGRGSLVGCHLYGVTQSRTRLKRLSSSSSSSIVSCLPYFLNLPGVLPWRTTFLYHIPGDSEPQWIEWKQDKHVILSFLQQRVLCHLSHSLAHLWFHPPLWDSPGHRKVVLLLLSLSTPCYAKSLQSCPTLCDPIDGSHQAPPSLGFSRQEHRSGLPFHSPMHESERWKQSRSVVSDS